MNPIQAAELAGGILNVAHLSEENKIIANKILLRALNEIDDQTQEASLKGRGIHLVK